MWARLFAVNGDVQLLRATQDGNDHDNRHGGRPKAVWVVYGGESKRPARAATDLRGRWLSVWGEGKLKKLLGPHLGGQWANKIEVLRKWQPPFVLVLSPDADKVAQLRAACPQAIVAGRFYHEDSHYASNIAARPKEFAREIHQEIIANPVTPLLDYVQTNNEVCQDWQGIQRLDVFTQEWMALADQSQAYKCAILAFSVGNPDMPHKPGDPAGFDGRMLYWQQVLPSLNYAQRNDHILLLHAYGYPNMFAPDADWYIYRYERQVQAHLRTLGITDLKYVYGEIGIDRLIVNGKGGYKVVTTDQDYTNQLLQWERDQQDQNLLLGGAIFGFGDSGGWDSYDIASGGVASMLATHYVEHANEYESSPVEGQNDMTETFLPSVGTGKPDASQLPPRNWDPRLTARGVTIETPPIAPGQAFWRVVKARWYNEQEADGVGPDHHILVDVLDGAGRRVGPGLSLLVEWPGDHTLIYTEAKAGELWAANYPMSKSLNEFSISVNDALVPSETLKGIGMGADGNSAVHTSTGVTFQLATMPSSSGPTTVEPPKDIPMPSNDNWARSIAFTARWEGGYQNVANDVGNWTGGAVGVGENKGTNWGVSAASYPHLDIKNLTREQAHEIFKRDYWVASGADKLSWPACLIVFDTAILHGVGTAKAWQSEVGTNAFAFAAKRLHVYTKMSNWDYWGRGWVNRTAELLEEMGK